MFLADRIPNGFNFGDACLGQTWYLACDMQMYIVSPILIYPLFKEWKIWKININLRYNSLTGIFCAQVQM